MSDPSQAQPPVDKTDDSSAAGDTPTPNAPNSNDSAAASQTGEAVPSAPAEPPLSAATGASGESGQAVEAPAEESTTSSVATPGGDASETASAGGEAPSSDAGAAETAQTEGASGEEGTKKKRRRRRRKKGAAAAEGAEHAQAEEGEKPKEKKEPAGVFTHLFAGGPRKHAFAAGEVVAGRVTKVEAGVATIDLFGKAVAFMDVLEPREVPVAPEPPKAEDAASAEAGASNPEAATESGSAEASAEAPTAEGTTAAQVSPETSVNPSAEPPATPSGDTTAEAPAEVSSEPAQQEVSVEAAPVQPEPAGASAQPLDEVAAEAVPPAAPAAEPAQPEGEAAAGAAAAAPTQAEGEAAAATEAAEASSQPADASPAPAEGVVADVAAGEAAKKAEPVEITPEFVEPFPEAPSVGQILRGRIGSVSESGHIVLVNRLIDRPAAKAQIRAARDAKQRVAGVVYGFNRGGFDVLVRGVRVFCPARSMSLSPIQDPEAMLGQKAEFTVSPTKGSGSSLVVGRRGILEREQRKQAKALLKSLEPGQKLTGKVTQVREFGVFVDIGGIEGLVHQSEISHSRGVRPADVAKPGDEVEVQVLKLGGGEGSTRKDRDRVSLSMRALQPDPWDAHEELLRPGSVRQAKVVRLTDFGAFMELAPMIEGLLHISELGRDLKHANAVLNEGEQVHVVVERVDRKQRRISLSRLSPSEQEALEAGNAPDPEVRLPKPGKTVKVVVDRVEHAGLVVRVPGIFGKRGRGFVPNSEVGTERGTDHRRMFPAGMELEVKVIGTDRDGGLRCSKKALTLDEEKRAVQDYRKEVAKQGLGTFGDLLREKLGAGKGS